MLARIRKATHEKDQGFTLIELLVVMIIIGILAAIAIPVFLSQRAKARDSSTKADVSTVGKELATYFVDGTATPGVAITAATATTPAYAVITATGYTSGNIPLSAGTAMQASTAGFTASPTATTWCVGMTNTEGSQKTYKYSSAAGLLPGACP